MEKRAGYFPFNSSPNCNTKKATKRHIYLKVTSGTKHLTPLWKGRVKEIVWLT